MGESLERAERALRQLKHGPRSADSVEIVDWAEETLFSLGEISEWIADTWERVAGALEAVAGLEPQAPAPDTPGEPTTDDLLGQASFLDDMAEASPDEHHAA